jgi:acetyl-CoA acyltransferase
MLMEEPKKDRVAIIQALRTPFVKSFGVFEYESPLSLCMAITKDLLAQTGVNPLDIGMSIWGVVVPQTKTPNLGRDVILFGGLPKHIPGYTVNKACATSLQTTLLAADAIQMKRFDVALVGGVEVLSDVPIVYSDDARRFLTRFSRAKNLTERLMLLKTVKLSSFLPVPPALTEAFTGLTMGEHAEIMTVKNNIHRKRQDEFAYLSHKNAAEAQKKGYFKDEITPIFSGKDKKVCISQDNIIREDISLDALAKLKPAFDKKHGTITAGNASPLTDGASGALIASESYAHSHNLDVLGYVVDALSVAADPNDQLLIGPAHAIPKLLNRHNLKMQDVDVYEIHEAFAGQVLSCLDRMNDESFCQSKLNLPRFGLIEFDRLNVDGGAIAIGHPFGATGIRLISHALRLLKRKNGRYAVVSACTAGGMAMAMLLERA